MAMIRPRAWSAQTRLRQLNAEGPYVGEPIEPSPQLEAIGGIPSHIPYWPSDADSPCYRHIGVGFSAAPFALTAEAMQKLCEANFFQDALNDHASGRPVLFGLRGCTLLGTTWTNAESEVWLREDVPDHAIARCVIGVWHQDTVGLVRGSTVPNFEYMNDYMTGSGSSNMLPTGCYKFMVGTHVGRSKNFYPLVFRLDQDVVPLRSTNDLCYTRSDFWGTVENVNDNIHPSILTTTHVVPRFSSAGCQTVMDSTGKNTGNYTQLMAQLRELAGNPANNTNFRYVLLTGREARLAATDPTVNLKRLRIGSNDNRVMALQTAIGLSGPTSLFGPNTLKGLITWQKSRNQALGQGSVADGVLSLAEAAALNISL